MNTEAPPKYLHNIIDRQIEQQSKPELKQKYYGYVEETEKGIFAAIRWQTADGRRLRKRRKAKDHKQAKALIPVLVEQWKDQIPSTPIRRDWMQKTGKYVVPIWGTIVDYDKRDPEDKTKVLVLCGRCLQLGLKPPKKYSLTPYHGIPEGWRGYCNHHKRVKHVGKRFLAHGVIDFDDRIIDEPRKIAITCSDCGRKRYVDAVSFYLQKRGNCVFTGRCQECMTRYRKGRLKDGEREPLILFSGCIVYFKERDPKNSKNVMVYCTWCETKHPVRFDSGLLDRNWTGFAREHWKEPQFLLYFYTFIEPIVFQRRHGFFGQPLPPLPHEVNWQALNGNQESNGGQKRKEERKQVNQARIAADMAKIEDAILAEWGKVKTATGLTFDEKIKLITQRAVAVRVEPQGIDPKLCEDRVRSRLRTRGISKQFKNGDDWWHEYVKSVIRKRRPEECK
jgi:hypothetical protein